ncbi:MAG: anaerobic ribonucleoside-triphosphate reductase activating protein [Bacilli bacterium]|nr:anaerobic ribonucleoside-triphosphate reductase activating protein [Bacilli bacterium]MDD4282264.1 anaerobic ribonucleoside-triphosphate reductase activating protein [Bacilli bacterium]MDD4718410.1 anaerobic ribonucleoside-triphosphate reductase activating protein [Bacilli bacterium]
MTVRLARPIQRDSIVDGEGLRTVIWTQGCAHKCFGCHNPSTHSFKEGFLQDIEELKEQIKNSHNQDGITLSGGDPFFQLDASLEISSFSQSIGLNVWAYTGYTFEQLMLLSKKNDKILKLLQNIDVLVDGRFDLSKKSLDWKFRGSKNQRIIDVKKSLRQNKAVIITKYNKQNSYNILNKKEKNIYV